jgi:hypothetical protein
VRCDELDDVWVGSLVTLSESRKRGLSGDAVPAGALELGSTVVNLLVVRTI